MWRRKAFAIGGIWLAAACAAAPGRQAARLQAEPARAEVEVELRGCLLAGAAPGAFVLDVAGPEARAVDVLSTRIGLTRFLGRRVAVRGREEATPRNTIIEVTRVFRIRALEVLADRC